MQQFNKLFQLRADYEKLVGEQIKNDKDGYVLYLECHLIKYRETFGELSLERKD